jgi:hypothetical protein
VDCNRSLLTMVLYWYLPRIAYDYIKIIGVPVSCAKGTGFLFCLRGSGFPSRGSGLSKHAVSE